MDSTMPRRTIVALTAIALLALPTTAAASGDGKDHTKNGATGDYAYGPLPPSGPAKDYDKNAATGAYSGWRSTEPRDAAPSTEPVSPSPAQVVATVADPGGLDWSDAAIGAGVGATLAFSAVGLTAVVRRRRIVSPAGAGSSGAAQ
jgi:type II secretory pathway pseudopilin PulG